MRAQQRNGITYGALETSHAEEDNFAFSVLRKTMANVFNMLGFGNIGMSFSAIALGTMKSLNMGFADKVEKVLHLDGLASGDLLTFGAIFGSIGVVGMLVSSAITTQIECEQARRAKCAKLAQQPQKELQPQIVIMPVQDVAFSQHMPVEPKRDIDMRDAAHINQLQQQLKSGKYTRLIDHQRQLAEMAQTSRT